MSGQEKSRSWLTRLAPYVLAAAMTAWVLHKVSPREIATQMALGHPLRMLPFALAVPLVVWLPYAAADRIVIAAAIGRVPYLEIVRAKAATAVLLILGYFFGGGGYAVWIAPSRSAWQGSARRRPRG